MNNINEYQKYIRRFKIYPKSKELEYLIEELKCE